MKRLRLGVILGFVFALGFLHVVFASQSQSTNYKVNEVQFGSGGLLNSSSANYKSQQSVGSTGAGNLSSASYAAQAGYLTPNAPFLEMVVTAATINLGALSPITTATGTATFHVRAYVDSGYTVLSMNDTPVSEDGVHMAGMTSAAASSPGTEQFGMNLVQNLTSCATPAPANFGVNPVPIPNSSYAHGAAATGYDTCGLFKYNKGDIVANSTSNGWGETDYTIAYIENVNAISKAGTYTVRQDLVVVPTY